MGAGKSSSPSLPSYGGPVAPTSTPWGSIGGTQSNPQPSGTQNFGGGGVGSKKGAPPAAPDYYGAANATSQGSQAAVNQQTGQNRPDQQTGFGSETWTIGPNGEPVQTTSLNPTLGGALGSLQGQAASNAANGPQNSLAAQEQAINANYGQAVSRLNPQWNAATEANQSALVNSGFDPSSQAYQTQMTEFNNAKNDAYQTAINDAIGMGNQTAGVQMAEQMQPYQEMGALQGFQNGLPGFNAAGQYQGPNYLGAAEAAGGYGMQGTQMNNQAGGDVWGGIGQLAGAGASAAKLSDERVKKNIKRLPVEAAPGIPAATFQYKHDPSGQHHVGVIAQDVEKVAPQHVQQGPDGLKRVNYGAFKPFGFK